MAFIEVKDLRFNYNPDEIDSKEALSGINIQIEEGEFVALLGHNGCGKSTLAKIFNGMYTPTSGQVFIDGLDSAPEENRFPIRRKVGLVQQNPDNQLVAGIVEEDVAFGPENLGVPPLEIRKRVDEALKTVGMYEYKEHAPFKLSGGQKQRVAIAGILAMETGCIVLDEPTAMLDPQGRLEVVDTLRRLNDEKGITIILITHYMDEATRADRVIVMDEGKILIEGPPTEVFTYVDILKEHQLDVPQATELAYLLKENGIDLGGHPMNTPECIELLTKYIKENGYGNN